MQGRKKRSGVGRRAVFIGLAVVLIGVGVVTFVLMSQTQSAPPVKSSSAGEEYGVIETTFGRMVIRFFPQDAPRHVENFKKLAREGFYNGTAFHRVIPGFMIQGGDPNSKDDDKSNDGMGGPGYTVPAEFNSRSHKRGIVSMARAADPNSAGSQFFIVVKDSTFLDKQYTVFGEVVKGIETADTIVSQPRDANDNPLEKITMKVYITPTP